MQALIAAGVNVNATNRIGATALFVAASFGHIDIVNALLAVNGIAIDTVTDYSALTLLRRCGIRAPKVKLKGTKEDSLNGIPNTVYLFSTDITQLSDKHPLRKYRFFSEKDAPLKNDCIESAYNLALSDDAKSNALNQYPIDMVSSVRLQIMKDILGLTDLNEENIGCIISIEEGKVKAKRALVDFCVDVKDIAPERYHFFTKAEVPYLQEAFKKVEANFLTACDQITANITNMDFETEDRKSTLFRKMGIWKNNFSAMKGIIAEACKQAEIEARHNELNDKNKA